MKRLRQKAKQTLCTLLVPLTLGVALPQKANAQETSKPLEAKVEVMSKHDDNGDLANKKLRTTLSYDKFMFRLDKNWDRRSQYAFDFKAIDKEKTKLALSTGGDLEDNGDKYAHEFSATLTQYMGRLPILGETTAKIHLLSSFRKDDNSFQKYRANLIGEHFDLAYQLRVEREEVDGKREKDPQYYLAFHNKDVWISLGKKRDNKIQGVFTTIGRPNFSLMTFGN